MLHFPETMDQLPPLVLDEIFELAIRDNEAEGDHGGAVLRWNSNELAFGLLRVCKSWLDTAIEVLYRSIVVLDDESARLFLDAVAAKSELATKVRYLVIGLSGEMMEELKERRSSENIVFVLDVCAQLRHLQIRPLHDSVRKILLAAVVTKPLLTLICAPRIASPSAREWFRSDDVALALPSLTRLELDFWGAAILDLPAPSIPSCPSLRHIQLHFSYPSNLVFAIIEGSPNLVTADLYFERLAPQDRSARAFESSVGTLKHLRFISNPTSDELDNFDESTKAFLDHLFPKFQALETLSVSATDISIALFRSVPPTLRHLTIQSYNHRAIFSKDRADELLETLRDGNLDIRLETFKLYDLAEAWEELIPELREAFVARGIEFSFEADTAVDE